MAEKRQVLSKPRPRKKKTDNERSTEQDGEKPGNTEMQLCPVSQEETQVDMFDQELSWCIGQLQRGLERQRPDSRQAMESIKVLKILKSTKAPLVKKRQAMRQTCGDYRKKMKDEEEKIAKSIKKMALTPVPSTASNKSQFFKKSTSFGISQSNVGCDIKDTIVSDAPLISDTENMCRNELPNYTMDNSISDSASATENPVENVIKDFEFIRSDNEFKFEFCVNTEGQEADQPYCADQREDVTLTYGTNNEVTSGASENSLLEKSDNSFRFGFPGPMESLI